MKISASDRNSGVDPLDEIVEALADRVVMLDADDRVIAFNRLPDFADPSEPALYRGAPFAELIAAQAAADGFAGFDRELVLYRDGGFERMILEPPEPGPGWTAEAVAAHRLAIHALAPCDHVQYSALTGKWWLVRERATRSGGIIITYVDITALKQSEYEVQIARTEAEIADRAKTEFLSHLSHELRTPLNAVVGFAELLGNGIAGPLNDRQRGYACDIAQAGRSMLSLVGDILNLSLLAGDSYVLKDEDVDLAALLAELATRHADRAVAGEVLVTPIPPLPCVRGDGLALKFVLDNLLSNAIKFSPPGGTVAIDMAIGADGLALTIADKGPGIEGALLRHVFEPFQRRTAATAREAKGFGLGLAVGQGFLHLHGGSLEIESRPGRGTVATVRLPAERLAP